MHKMSNITKFLAEITKLMSKIKLNYNFDVKKLKKLKKRKKKNQRKFKLKYIQNNILINYHDY